MDNLPLEIQNYILDYIFDKKCYLSDISNSNNIKKCACVSKQFNKKFICKPKFLYLSKTNFIEFCKCHDKVLIENCRVLFKSIIKNYNFNFNYFIKLRLRNNNTISVPLSVFNLEPYISVMDDNYFLYHLDVEFYKNISEIKEINDRVIKKIFEELNIQYNNQIKGYNNEKLKKSVSLLNYFVNETKKFI